MTTCIKTGAVVHFPEWNMTHAADLYAVGNCILIKMNYADFYASTNREVTHHAVVWNTGYIDKDKRIAFIPADQMKVIEVES